MTTEKIGITCAYTPLVLLDAAGFAPYRILPVGDWPDQAGHLLHDNICPHVKKILDRAVAEDLPKLSGVVFMNSCDAMQRLSDSWHRVRPNDKTIVIDLPVASDERSVTFLAYELKRLRQTLSEWRGSPISDDEIQDSWTRYNRLARLFESLQERQQRGVLKGGVGRLQGLYNRAATSALAETIEALQDVLAEEEDADRTEEGVPIYLFGNVLADPESLSLFEDCGGRIVVEDMCTGSRMFPPMSSNGKENDLMGLAHSLLNRPACARTFDPHRPGHMAQDVLERAQACQARGVIAHTVKFCDPYLARLPAVRVTLQEAGIPFLLLEGDCTMRSIGQHRTRIEAFIEMLR